jgi:signal transduction histidine kinase
MDEATDPTRAFVADVAHDLQNPLTGMRTQLEVALAHSSTVVAENWIQSMLAATLEMELLVSDLLALAAEESDHQPAPRELLDLDTLVRQEAGRPRPATTVVIDVEHVGPIKVRGDERSLRRLVRNLLDNAVRHAGAVVWIRLHYGRDVIVLDVVDDGPGVPAEHLDRIFDRFYRADPQSSDGTGLGLAIVRQVAERHDGTAVMLPGGQGEGAHFRIELPIPD